MNPPDLAIMPADERAAAIAKAVHRSKKRANVPFRGKYVPVPVVSVPVALPVYRADNGRLAALEANHISQHQLDADHFLDNQETPEVQAVLHGFLSVLSERPDGPIKDALARAAQQIEPLLVTSNGVVVNGNRRLAAMRDLLAKDAKAYAVFKTCDVAVLPGDASRTDIEFIEAALQLAPETKLAYGWIDRRLKLRHQRDNLGLPSEDIVKHYHLQSAGQIDTELGELELAEDYLREFLKRPHDYGLVDWAEEPFTQLHKRLGRDRNPQHAAAVKLVGFCLIKAAADDESLRPIKLFPFVDQQPGYLHNMLLHRLGGELGLWPVRADELSLGAPSDEDLARLSEVLGKSEQAGERAAMIAKTVSDIVQEYETRPNPQVVVQRLRQVTRLANRVEPGDLTQKQRAEIARELNQIMGLCGMGADGAPPPPAAHGGVLVNVAQSLEETGKSILRDFRKSRKDQGLS